MVAALQPAGHKLQLHHHFRFMVQLALDDKTIDNQKQSPTGTGKYGYELDYISVELI